MEEGEEEERKRVGGGRVGSPETRLGMQAEFMGRCINRSPRRSQEHEEGWEGACPGCICD